MVENDCNRWFFVSILALSFYTKRREQPMTMKKKFEKNPIWSSLREDRDIDDMIFGYDTHWEPEERHTTSDR